MIHGIVGNVMQVRFPLYVGLDGGFAAQRSAQSESAGKKYSITHEYTRNDMSNEPISRQNSMNAEAILGK